MRVPTVHMKSFASFSNLSIQTDARRVLITGHNGSGKSSVREAVKWALTGRCAVTDQKGSGVEMLIPQGGSPAVEVVVELAGLGGVSRAFQGGVRTLAVNGFIGDSSSQQSALYDRLKTTPEYLDAVLDTGHFLNLHHADAKALVLALLDVRVDVDGSSRTIDEVDVLYRKAFEDRKYSKTKLRTFNLPAMPSGDQPHPVEAIQGQIEKIRAQMQTLTATVGKAAGQRQNLLRDLERTKVYVSWRGEIPAEEVDRQIAVLEPEIASMEAELDIAVAMPTRPDPDAPQNVTLIRQRMDALTAHKPKSGCVLDGEVPCETHKLKFTARVKALQATLDGLEGADVPAGPSQPAQPSESPLRAARSRLQGLRTMKLKYETSAVQARDRQAEIDRITAELEALPADAQGEADLEALKGRIAKGETLLIASRAYWTALYNHQEGLKERQRLEGEVNVLEQRCEKLGPNGVKAEALKPAIGAFETKINRFTSQFGWTLTFKIDPWGVVANGRPVETYSESQQFLIGIAVQLAIAEVSGISFAVVDRLDMLDVANRTKASQMLAQCALEQVFMLSTREANQPLPSARTGLIAHRIELKDGQTRIVESVGV